MAAGKEVSESHQASTDLRIIVRPAIHRLGFQYNLASTFTFTFTSFFFMVRCLGCAGLLVLSRIGTALRGCLAGFFGASFLLILPTLLGLNDRGDASQHLEGLKDGTDKLGGIWMVEIHAVKRLGEDGYGVGIQHQPCDIPEDSRRIGSRGRCLRGARGEQQIEEVNEGLNGMGVCFVLALLLHLRLHGLGELGDDSAAPFGPLCQGGQHVGRSQILLLLPLGLLLVCGLAFFRVGYQLLQYEADNVADASWGGSFGFLPFALGPSLALAQRSPAVVA